MCYLLLKIPLHAARRVMAAVASGPLPTTLLLPPIPVTVVVVVVVVAVGCGGWSTQICPIKGMKGSITIRLDKEVTEVAKVSEAARVNGARQLAKLEDHKTCSSIKKVQVGFRSALGVDPPGRVVP